MITEVHRGLGGWQVNLRPDTPPSVLAQVDPDTNAFGHLIVTSARVDPKTMSAATLLAQARYSGVLMRSPDLYQLEGVGLAFWMGDDEGKGPIIEPDLTKTSGTFVQWVTDLCPPGLDAGTYTAVAGALAHSFSYIDRRTALNYTCDYFGGEWKINPNRTLDAGAESDLFVVTPTAIVQRLSGGRDSNIIGIRADVARSADVYGYTTRAIVIASGEGAGQAVGAADASPATSFRDGNGNLVSIAQVVESSDTEAGNQNAVAQAVLDEAYQIRHEVTLSSDAYDIGLDVSVGDSIWIYDVDRNLVDVANTVQYRGQLLHPIKMRVLAYNWPVRRGMGVYFQAPTTAGAIIDLSDWVEFDAATDPVSISVGATPKKYVDDVGGSGSTARVAALGPAGVLKYIPLTADQGPITTLADITGSSAAADVGPNRYIGLTAHCEFATSVNGQWGELYIYEGAGQLARGIADNLNTAGSSSADASVVLRGPAAGSHTYKLMAARTIGAGNVTFVAAALREAYLKVEDLGYAS